MRQIGHIEFETDRVIFTFMDVESDIRNKGLVMATHTLIVLRHKAYEDEIAALEEAATELLEDAYDDYQNTDPVPTHPETEEDPDGERA